MLTAEQFLALDLPVVVLYHKNCSDGFGAAYTAWIMLHGQSGNYPDTYIPVAYNEPVPELPERCALLIVDFSYPREVMLELAKKHALVVLDHHKTAKAACEGLDFCLFDMNRSGTMMVRDYFDVRYPSYQAYDMAGACPGFRTIADYIQDRDLWQWKLPGSREFSAALASYPTDFGVWSTLHIADLVSEGAAILRYQKQLVERICSNARTSNYFGKIGVGVDTPVLQSETGEHLLVLHPEAVFADMAYHDPEMNEIHSLRSRSAQECDVSVIAKSFLGGGGHACAAGFRIPHELSEDPDMRKE